MRDYPLVVFAISFVVLWLAAYLGATLVPRDRSRAEIIADFGIVLGATLALLALIIGFTFSMAVSRYDLRVSFEAREANAIGTEYLRSQLLPPPDAAKLQALLKSYTDQRILFYTTYGDDELQKVGAITARIQADLWSIVRDAAGAQPNAIRALAVGGMNDVIDSQGYTQAAAWNRIPRAAWALMAIIAVCCNVLLGYGSRSIRNERVLMLIVPLVVSISFLLIADIDSPRRGIIRVAPQNLIALSDSLRSQ